MFLDKLSKKEKIGLSLAFMVLLAASMDRLIFSPIGSRFKKIDEAIKNGEKQLRYDLRNVHLKDQIEGEFEKYVQYVERSGSDEEEVAKILGEIESLARQAKVSLVDVKPKAAQKIDFYKQYAVEIEAEGEIEDLITFLHQVNISTQLLRVEKLRLNSKEGQDTQLKSSMLITKVLVF